MYELKVKVTKVLGTCTAEPPMVPGDYVTVRHGDIRIPEGGYICLWALQSLLPVITPKEREIAEDRDEDWMWRVHHVQCPDPDGRVIFEIERAAKISKATARSAAWPIEAGQRNLSGLQAAAQGPAPGVPATGEQTGGPRSLRVVVEEVRGKCTSGMQPGDCFYLHRGRLTIPAGRHFCLYALQAVLPFLPAKQRRLEDGDWMVDAHHVICPDPAGNVLLRIELLL